MKIFGRKITRELQQQIIRQLEANGREVCFRWGGHSPKHDGLEGVYNCLEWQGAVTESGYGSVGIPWALTGGQRKTERVHRLMWILNRGPIPEGMVIHHACRNRKCFNLQHLQLTTQSENNTEMMKRRTAKTSDHYNDRRFILYKEEIYFCRKAGALKRRYVEVRKFER